MNFYSTEELSKIKTHKFAFLEIDIEANILTITLDRADKKNALHPQMLNEIAFAMSYAHATPSIWIVVFQAKGNVFCAGADLKALMGLVEPNDSTIPQPSSEILIGELFNKVNKPTIAKVTGDVYAGGFFFLAGCNIVIAKEDVKFGLPEVKRGLFPFQVMATLMKVMPSRKVLDWCIRGYILPVLDAEKYGLVTHLATAENIEELVNNVVDELKLNSPTAIKYGLEAYDHILPTGETHAYLMQKLQKTIASKDGQEGLKAFKEKRKPVWVGS